MPERITGKTQLIGLLGTPIGHSNSPRMQNEAFAILGLDYAYLAFDVGNEGLEAAVKGFRALGVRGFHVTMPNKAVVPQYLDELSEAAQLCGSVNTVVNENGKLVGHNTDGYGFIKNLQENGVCVQGSSMVLIGAGGAASAICAQAALEGVSELSVFGIADNTYSAGERICGLINRKTDCRAAMYLLEEGDWLTQKISQCSILVNATPVGMGKWEGKSPVADLSMVRPETTVADVIYSPPKSKLLALAEEKGCRVINGLGMMLWQGAKSFEIWTGRQMPLDAVRELVESFY